MCQNLIRSTNTRGKLAWYLTDTLAKIDEGVTIQATYIL